MAKTARALAVEVLARCTGEDRYSNLALDTVIRRNPLEASDRALLTALVYGVIEKQLTLDYYISVLAKRPIDEIAPQALTLLRLGLYQLAFMDRIPTHAAVNETVELAPRRVKGFVNAVLRAYGRANGQIELPHREDDPIFYLSVRYSFAQSVCAKFLEEFGEARAEELLASFSKQPPLTLRVNTLKTDRDAYLNTLLEAGYHAEPTRESRTGVCVFGNAPVRELPGFEEGLFYVQDEASQLCVEAVDAKEGMTVLDVCACPGSKSFGVAIGMENVGRLFACDLHENKLSLVRSGAERLGISIVETLARDARTLNEAWIGSADRVLCDVPCSGFGVLAKKPELRYKDPAESAPLPDIQLAILKNCSRYVKAGGVLVYSTCTVFPEENEENIKRFLESEPSFSLDGFEFGTLRQGKETLSLYPDTHHTDGFFVARMIKKK